MDYEGMATMVVQIEDLAKNIKSGSLDVLATPRLSALMEEASCNAVASLLKEGETTVGGMISVKHTAPSLLGEGVTARAKVISVNGKKIELTVTASDSHGEIGSATHTRFIVKEDEFMRRAKERHET